MPSALEKGCNWLIFFLTLWSLPVFSFLFCSNGVLLLTGVFFMSSLPFTLPLGEAVTEGPGDGLTTLQTDSYQLKPHLEKPWLRAYLKERITGGDIKTENDKIAKSRNGQSASVCATAHALQRPTDLVGFIVANDGD